MRSNLVVDMEKKYQRTIQEVVERRLSESPVVILTGPRQVGKSTLARAFLANGYRYVSFDDPFALRQAKQDPATFLAMNPCPLILDEIQRAPMLFPYLEQAVNERKMSGAENCGMFLLTGSQSYGMMKGVTESLAGRVSIVRMSPLSRNEILSRKDIPFSFDPLLSSRRAEDSPLDGDGLQEILFRGTFPRLWERRDISPSVYYADYVASYLMRDVQDIVDVKDPMAFSLFLEVLASFTGQELVYDTISKAVGVTSKTIKAWTHALSACGIVHLLEPYSDASIVKRVVKRPKVYFADTGLAAHLLRIDSPATLKGSFVYGRIYETYVFNEFLKSFRNNGTEPSLYYYRDTSQREIDLVLVKDASLHPIEIKAGMEYGRKDIRAFPCLDGLRLPRGKGALLCAAAKPYPIDGDTWAYPLASL